MYDNFLIEDVIKKCLVLIGFVYLEGDKVVVVVEFIGFCFGE